jgi:hypothetical protein
MLAPAVPTDAKAVQNLLKMCVLNQSSLHENTVQNVLFSSQNKKYAVVNGVLENKNAILSDWSTISQDQMLQPSH